MSEVGFDSVCFIVYFNMVINLNGANTFVLADTKKEDFWTDSLQLRELTIICQVSTLIQSSIGMNFN